MYQILRWGLNGGQPLSILTKRLPSAVSRLKSDLLIPIKQTKRTPDLMKTNEENEILIYKHDKSNFIKNLKYVSTSFFVVVALSDFSFLSLLDLPTRTENPEFFFFEREEQKKAFKFFVTASFLFGSLIYFFVCMYVLRNVRSLVFKRDTKEVIFETYSIIKKYRTLTVPVYNVSGVNRLVKNSKTGYITLKVKDNMLYYILDVNGKMLNRPLFDGIINLQRTIPRFSLWKTLKDKLSKK